MVIRVSLGLALIIACAVSGCGGPSEAQRQQSRGEELTKLSSTLQTRLSEQAQGKKQACATAIGGFIDEVTGLNSRLNIGMNYNDYSSKVADAQVAYDRVERTLSGGCYDAGVAAERALNQYIAAYQIWKNCFDSDYCTNDSIDSELQAHWLKASTAADKAKDTLERVGSGLTVGSKRFPTSDSETADTIYGAIQRLVCSPPDPPATEAPCTELRNLLAGGVNEDEQNSVDDQVKKLVDALGLNPS